MKTEEETRQKIQRINGGELDISGETEEHQKGFREALMWVVED